MMWLDALLIFAGVVAFWLLLIAGIFVLGSILYTFCEVGAALLLEDLRPRCCEDCTPEKCCLNCEMIANMLWIDVEHHVDAMAKAAQEENAITQRIEEFYTNLPADAIDHPIPRCMSCGVDLRMYGCWCAQSVKDDPTSWTIDPNSGAPLRSVRPALWG